MAFHHQNHHINSHPITTTSCCCCCCFCTPSHHPPSSDPLLQSIPSQLLRPPQPHLYSPYPNPTCNTQLHQTQYYSPQPHQQKQRLSRHHHQREEQTHPIVSTLLDRIAALESALCHRSSSDSHSLRDAAARTIQTYFRAFLVRRSRTLRHLKDLASIKSTLNTLKSSVPENAHFNSQALSRKAMGMLIKLDSLQGDDPIIRDGKRSISRELIQFMEFIDRVSVQRTDLSRRTVKNARYGCNGNKSRVLYGNHKMGTADCENLEGDEKELMKNLRGKVEKIREFSRVPEDDDNEDEELENTRIFINGKCGVSHGTIGGLLKRRGGVQAKLKKSVSFAENGNVYRICRSSHEPVSNGDCNRVDETDSIDAETELIDNLHGEVEEIGVSSKETRDDEEARTDDGGSSSQNSDESFVFSAPLPVKMETRADFMNKRKNESS